MRKSVNQLVINVDDWRGAARSQHAADQPFEIFAFGKGDGDRMVHVLASPFENLHAATHIHRRAKDHFLKEVGTDQAAAAKGGEDAK